MQRVASPPPLPARPHDGHKGTFGRVLVVGGNDQMVGAPVLAGTSALKLGAGLVQIAVPRSILAAAISITPELIGLGLGRGGGTSRLLDAAENSDALVIGPGLGQSPESRDRLPRLFRLDKPAVVDADALNILSSRKKWPGWFALKAVLTPHPGEMKRLGKLFGIDEVPDDDDGRLQVALKAHEAFGQVILLKGARTVITDGKQVYLNRTGDSSLAKAGTGDILSGMIGALLGQKLSGFDAACLATHLHGRAGELAGKKLGQRSVLARDVIASLPEAIAEYEQKQPTAAV